MKKIFIVLIVSLGFTIAGSAQIKKAATTPTTVAAKTDAMTAKMKAQKNVADLEAFMKLTPEDSQDFLGLFTTKISMMDEAGISEEKKSQVSRIISSKIEASVDAATFEKLKASTALYKSLIN